ncbi:MAG: DNA helicase RecG, partial [Thermodesulfobacteriota bacterium]
RRLKVMEQSTDGFRIAEEDLKIRGPGDYLGERQSGIADFQFAWALLDYDLVKAAKSEAETFVCETSGLTRGYGPWIAKVLKARWSHRLELAGIA